MAHIYVYSPSGAVIDRRSFHRGIKRLQALGHEVEVDPDALARFQRFAGDDATRLAAITRAARSGADVALISRGGYGLTRLLPAMPWDAICRAVDKGMHWVGFSDFTALQLGLLRGHPHAVTWAGPALCEGFGQLTGSDDAAGEQPDEVMLACFSDLMAGTGEGTGWQLPASDRRALALQGQPDLLAQHATLWGGNLAMIASLIGTPWLPSIRQGVLFLEDVGEHPYRIERMLLHLLHAGILAQQQAVVLGQFTCYSKGAIDRGFSLATVVDHLRAHTQTPILTNLPFGHVPTKVLLPVGAATDLVIDKGEALLLWGHLH